MGFCENYTKWLEDAGMTCQEDGRRVPGLGDFIQGWVPCAALGETEEWAASSVKKQWGRPRQAGRRPAQRHLLNPLSLNP